MTLPASGQISFNDLRIELGVSSQAPFSIASASTGVYATINTAGSSYPNDSTPHAISEWYSYYHDAKYSITVQVMSSIYDCCGTPDTTKYSNCSSINTNCVVYNTNGSSSPVTYLTFYDGIYVYTTDGNGVVTAQYGCNC